jgi:pimeloyl-ACP methyl ester carboxylesterase
MTNRSRWIVGTFAACVAATTIASPKPSVPVPVLNWAACDFAPWVECATATVPLDYDQPRGATTQLALARVPAADQTNKIGTVFLNPGGPGASGVDLAAFGFGEYLALLLDGRFDIVGFDPRGVAGSSPLYCFESATELNAFFGDAPLYPYLREQERPFFATYKSLGAQCASQHNPILGHMSTADVVRDLDLLRQAVGDAKLSYLGFSYGSFLGTTYANMFPDKVRALVIDGVLDPILWSSSWQVVSDRVATQKEFAEFLRLCDAAGEECELSGPDGAGARYSALAAALHEQPFDFGGGDLYSYDFLIADTVSAMYSPEAWGGFFGYGAYFAFLADAVLDGDAAAAETARAIGKEIQAQLKNASPSRADYSNGLEGYYGNHCADAEYPSTLPLYRAIGAFAASGSIFGPYWWWSAAGCADLAASADRYAGPWATRTSAPVLVVGNYFDGVTDYEGAMTSSQLLKNSRLLTYAGWGHTAFDRSACVTDYVVDYLRDGTLPPKGTVCPANPNPFLPVALSRSNAGRNVLPRVGLPPLRPGR